MAEITLEAMPVLGGVDLDIGGNRVLERSDLALVSVATPQGGEAELVRALDAGWSLAMPEPTLSRVAGETRAIRTAPDQMMLVFRHPTPDAERVVQAKLDGTGYTTEQTDVWVVLEVSGPDTLAALERLCPLDLDPARFPVGASGRSVMEHMGAMIVRLEPDRFWLLSARSSAGSFLHAVETSYRYVID
ncbi:MAG: sarcosine oxidase subunit gamma [Silicimonas sp.]|nr:sarcosine oxidase subunit gamma [Silicimonas sp.]